MSGLDVRTVADAEMFARMDREWDALLEASGAGTIFTTWEWLFTWWKHLARGRKLRVCVVRDGAELVAVAPLALRPAALGSVPPFPCLELLGAGVVGSDYVDVVARPDRVREAVEAIARHLAGGAHVLALRRLPDGDCLAAQLGGDLAARRWIRVEGHDETAPIIRLEGRSFDQYMATIGSAHRYAFRRKLRALGNAANVDLDLVRSEIERRAALETLIDLHRKRWRTASSTFGDPAIVAFHDEATRLLLERGWLRLMVLRLDGVPVAAFYGFRYGPTFSFYQAGFDPAFARRSVGLVMTGLAIRRACEEGAAEFDFLHGEEPYKFHWANAARPLRRIDLYPPGLRGWLVHRTAILDQRARRLARRFWPRDAGPPSLAAD